MKQKNEVNEDEIRKTILKVVAFILFILISIGSLAFYEHGLIRRKKDVNDTLKVYTYNQCNNVNSWIDRAKDPIETVKTYIESGNIKCTRTLQNLLDYSKREFNNYQGGVYIGSSNNEFFKGAGSNKTLKENVSDEYWYKEGITRVSVNLGNIHKDSNGNLIVSATGIVNDDDNTNTKVIGADILISTINAEIDDKYVNPNFNTIVVDREGTIIASKDEGIIGKSLYETNNKILSLCADKIKLKSYTAFNIDNTSIDFSVTKNDEWVVISYVSQKDINMEYKIIFIKILLILIIVSIISLYILNVIIKSICSDFKIVKNNKKREEKQ